MITTSIEDSVVYEIHVAARPERVFEALTNPAQVPQWWGGSGAGQEYRCTAFERELRVGGHWRCLGVDGRGGGFQVSGDYLELDPPRLLVSTWEASWTGDAKTIVRWELTATETGTQVTIRHSGFATHPEIAMAYRGWPQMLSWLRGFVESGETVHSRMG